MDADRRPSGGLRGAVGELRARLAIPGRTAWPRSGIRHHHLAAGISSTGDPALDARLPFDEPYRVPASTAAAILRTKKRGGRIVAVGTTVVRALVHSGGRAGEGVADQRIGAGTPLHGVDAMLSGTHAPDESHYQVLRAFQRDDVLARAEAALEASNYRTHEFGDSVLIFAQQDACADDVGAFIGGSLRERVAV